MKLLKLFSVFSLLLVLISCGPMVRTQKTTEQPLSMYDTFAYLPNTNAMLSEKSFNDSSINSIIVETIKDNMDQWYSLDKKSPDLLVLIRTAGDVEVGVATQPVYATYPYAGTVGMVSPFYEPYYYRGYAGFGPIVNYDTDLYAYKEGTLVINLVDRKTKEIVWKGVAKGNVYNLTNNDAIQEMVDNIFSEYPLDE